MCEIWALPIAQAVPFSFPDNDARRLGVSDRERERKAEKKRPQPGCKMFALGDSSFRRASSL